MATRGAKWPGSEDERCYKAYHYGSGRAAFNAAEMSRIFYRGNAAGEVVRGHYTGDIIREGMRLIACCLNVYILCIDVGVTKKHLVSEHMLVSDSLNVQLWGGLQITL